MDKDRFLPVGFVVRGLELLQCIVFCRSATSISGTKLAGYAIQFVAANNEGVFSAQGLGCGFLY